MKSPSSRSLFSSRTTEWYFVLSKFTAAWGEGTADGPKLGLTDDQPTPVYSLLCSEKKHLSSLAKRKRHIPCAADGLFAIFPNVSL